MQHSIAQAMSPCSLDWSFTEPKSNISFVLQPFFWKCWPLSYGCVSYCFICKYIGSDFCLAFYGWNVPLSRRVSSLPQIIVLLRHLPMLRWHKRTLAIKTLSLKEKAVRNGYLSWVGSRKNNHFIIVLKCQRTWIMNCKCCCPTLIQ